MDYIKLSRKITEWEWYKNINTCRLFIHMLLIANWKDGKYEGKTIPRGSFVSSLQKLAEETELTIREIRTAISHLKSTGEVTSKNYSKYTVFTVNNYCMYQTSDTQNDIQATSKRHSNDILTTTIEEKKEGKNIYNNNIYIAELPEQVKEIVDYLNQKCGTHYRHTTVNTKKHINARLNEKYTVDDFKTVIDKKCAEWKGTEMEKYLAPDTLFGSKFEKYLNQKTKGTVKNEQEATSSVRLW